MTSAAQRRRTSRDLASSALSVLTTQSIFADVCAKADVVRWLVKSHLIGVDTSGLPANFSATKLKSRQAGGTR